MGPLKSTAPLLALLVASAVLSLLPLAQSASSTFPSFSQYAGRPYSVTYDRRSIRLNDQPVVFMSGSIHYPRSTPGMWPSLMRAAAADGMNMIEIYVFWNYHEVVEGQFDWSGRGNLTLFLDTIAEAGLFANLRIGPYVCAEWDYGGIPSFLGYREGMRMRTYNQPWMDAVQSWFGRVIAETRGYFADRGGPIVLAQVENELYGAPDAYVQWNGDMAASFNVGVPWIMCNGQSANNTINACNGNDCAGFIDGNGQSGRILIDQPALWTENEVPPAAAAPPPPPRPSPAVLLLRWGLCVPPVVCGQGWFQQWGQETYPTMLAGTDRSPEEMAFVVSRWFARGGSHMNYYVRTRRPNTSLYTACRSPLTLATPSLLRSDVPRRQSLRPHSRGWPDQQVRRRRQLPLGRPAQRTEEEPPHARAPGHRGRQRRPAGACSPVQEGRRPALARRPLPAVDQRHAAAGLRLRPDGVHRVVRHRVRAGAVQWEGVRPGAQLAAAAQRRPAAAQHVGRGACHRRARQHGGVGCAAGVERLA